MLKSVLDSLLNLLVDDVDVKDTSSIFRQIQAALLMIAFIGVLSSIAPNLLKGETINKEDDISSRIKSVSTTLESSAQEINDLQAELEGRVEMVERLKEEAEQAEAIIQLTEDQVQAIRTTLNNELQREGRKSFWQGVAVNFVIYLLGVASSIATSIIVPKYFARKAKSASVDR